MTMIEQRHNGATGDATDVSDADARLLARAAWHESGGTLTGKELAARFGKSPRWGQDQRRAAEQDGVPAAQLGVPRAEAPAREPVPRPERKPKPAAKPRRDLVKDVGVVMVAAVMLAVSYNHIVHLALLAGCGWWAWVMPLPLDGMAVVSIRHLRQERRYWVAWAGIIIGLGGSLVANVVAFDPTLADMRHVGWAFAALPPLAVAVCLHLFDRGNRSDR